MSDSLAHCGEWRKFGAFRVGVVDFFGEDYELGKVLLRRQAGVLSTLRTGDAALHAFHLANSAVCRSRRAQTGFSRFFKIFEKNLKIGKKFKNSKKISVDKSKRAIL